jgi:hypothetical protein
MTDGRQAEHSVKRRRRVLIASCLAFVVAASAVVFFTIRYRRDPRDADARSRWQEQGLESYSFLLQQHGAWAASHDFGFFPEPNEVYVVNVVNGTVDSLAHYTDGTAVLKPGEWLSAATIDHLFDEIDEARGRACSVDVNYDTQRGFPRHVDIDWVEGIDDEHSYTVSRVEPLAKGYRRPSVEVGPDGKPRVSTKRGNEIRQEHERKMDLLKGDLVKSGHRLKSEE